MGTIQGMSYKDNPNNAEYQHFPEEYFSGCDVTIYFGDVFVSEISGIEFTLQEKVNPIYGYASNTWDDVARGSRIVNGSFKIPFKETGYLDTILTHIGGIDEIADPFIGDLLSGQKRPEWAADSKETIEDIFSGGKDKVEPIKPDKPDKPEIDYSKMFAGKFPIRPGANGEYIRQLKVIMLKITRALIEDPSPLQKYIIKKYKKADENGCRETAREMYQKYTNALKKPKEVTKLVQKQINHYMGAKTVVENGFYDAKTTAAVLKLCETFKLNPEASKAIKDSMKNKSKIAEKMSTYIIAELIGLDIEHDTRYNAQMVFYSKYFTKRVMNKTTNGILTEDIVEKMFETAKVKYRPDKIAANNTDTKPTENNKPIGNKNIENPIEGYYNGNEAEIWGRNDSKDTNHKYQTYFYTSRIRTKAVNYRDREAKLKKQGFDIFITYGPMEQAIKENGNKLPATFNFRSTVKAIRNVQLTSTGQSIVPNGAVVEELYTFLAKDLD